MHSEGSGFESNCSHCVATLDELFVSWLSVRKATGNRLAYLSSVDGDLDNDKYSNINRLVGPALDRRTCRNRNCIVTGQFIIVYAVKHIYCYCTVCNTLYNSTNLNSLLRVTIMDFSVLVLFRNLYASKSTYHRINFFSCFHAFWYIKHYFWHFCCRLCINFVDKLLYFG